MEKIGYRIYTLQNPINGDIFYVGKSFMPLSTRLQGHIWESYQEKRKWVNKKKGALIRAIINSKSKPIIEELEICENEEQYDSSEKYWIAQLFAWGCPLLNIRK